MRPMTWSTWRDIGQRAGGALMWLLVAAVGCDAGGAAIDIEAAGKPRVADHITAGVCLAHSWRRGGQSGYGTDASRQTLEHLDELGIEAVSVTPFGWMDGLDAVAIGGEHNSDLPDGSERADRLAAVAGQAHQLGMDVVLKPHLWIRNGQWRGAIAPKGADGQPAWDPWWANYRDFMMYYGRLAADIDAASLVVGVELVSAVAARPDQLVELIDDLREVYSGQLVYAANWDEQVPERIWRALDAVGVQFYPPITSTPDPGLDELRAGIRVHLDGWAQLAERLDKALVLTEVGYPATSYAAEAPYEWPETNDMSRLDTALQARLYRALFAEINRLPSIDGIYLWKYFTDRNTDEGGQMGYSPRGKPAEALLRRALAAD